MPEVLLDITASGIEDFIPPLAVTEKGSWASNTAYPAGSVVTNSGSRYLANTDLAGNSTFNAGNWILLGGTGSGGSLTIVDGGVWAPSTAYAAGTYVTHGGGRYQAAANIAGISVWTGANWVFTGNIPDTI